MGLDTSHDCWGGSYSGFSHFRRRIARAAGIPLDCMEGFMGHDFSVHLTKAMRLMETGATEEELSSWREFMAFLPIAWEALRPDPIHAFLNHSDCEGYLEIEDLLGIAGRLEELAEKFPDERWGTKEKAIQFAKGCRSAHAAGERVEFY